MLPRVARTGASPAGPEFVVGYVGRVTQVKGVHILMEGFSRLRERNARLRIVGWDPTHASTPYYLLLQNLARADPRVTLVPKKPFADALGEYQGMSLLAVPSVSFETGPLTLFEAQAMGVPVYGSNRLGQLEVLKAYGRIVEPNTPAGWARALEEAYALFQRGEWPKEQSSRDPQRKLRTMADVCQEIASYYRQRLPGGG
jgi:glycosyltransferase involved in cell wall biosynthesis